MDVKIVRDRSTMFHQTEKVVVTLSRPPGENYPGLHRMINDRIESRVGDDVTVDVRVTLASSE